MRCAYCTLRNYFDARLVELRGRADAKATVAADELQVKRDRLAVKLDSATTRADGAWDELKTDISNGFSTLEQEVDARF